MDRVLNIVEPTLTTQAGHCHSFLASLCNAADDFPICLWVGRGAQLTFERRSVQVEPYFLRHLRRPQVFWLYRQLLRRPGRIFVATATRTDLALLHLAAADTIEPGKVFLYFHWFSLTSRKLRFLEKFASLQPNLGILGPTPGAVEAFYHSGFRDVRVVPYPMTKRTANPFCSEREIVDLSSGFRHLLFAGIARQDKGITSIADLVTHLAQTGSDLPIVVQVSADHRHHFDAKTAQDIQRLKQANYPYLHLIGKTLHQDEYLALFNGGICLQPYDVIDFTDRVSGVSLDALAAGCPLVARAGTWSARVAERFGAGLTLHDTSPSLLLAAIRTIIDDWSSFQDKACQAGQILQKENNASHLMEVLTSHG
ncbi:conserved hypothetical protein [Gammaproteobacteria bacterium]